MRREPRFATLLGLAFLGGALGLWAWPDPQEPAQDQRKASPVRAATVEAATTTRSVRFSGVTRAARRGALSFPVPERLSRREVEVGDHVRKGQPLAALESQRFQNAKDAALATVAELEVRLEQAERDRRRVERLASVKAATGEELEHVVAGSDAVRAGLDAARAQLADAQRLLDEATLEAPFAGTITAVMLEPGEMAQPGAPVVEISGDGAIELRVEVPESVAPGLREGQPASVELPFARRNASGRIRSVARAAVGPGRLFPVIVTLDPAPALVAGMAAELVLETAAAQALAVPLRAVVNPGSSQPAVFVIRDGRARRVPIELGDLSGDRVTVNGELSLGEQVVVAGNTQIADGDPVEVLS
jgi:multidrug efflux system membrane fusion protein